MVWAQFNFNLYEVCNARQKIKDYFKKTYSKIGYFPVVICK